MGLDMYLEKHTYVQNWDHMTPEQRYEVKILRGGQPTGIKPERIVYIVEQVCYWRKANQIHKWFVDHVQDENDDCGLHPVSRDQLETLLDLCKQVLAASPLAQGKVVNGWTAEGPILVDGKVITNSAVAQELLPAQDGFFFGGTDYDEYYLDDIQHTADKLTEILAEDDSDYFYYRSSW